MNLSKNLYSLRNAVTCAALLLCGVAAAGPVNAPFKAEIAVAETLQFAVVPGCTFSGMTYGIGSASYLGKVVLSATDCVNPATGSGPGAFAFTGGMFTLTAADGDKVFATYSGTFVPAPTQAAPNAFTIVGGMYSITGGTGRFAGATGSGVLRGTEYVTVDARGLPSSSTGALQAIGVISLPSDNSQGQDKENASDKSAKRDD
ncbi:MAG: hypothetical protein NVSMB6_12240 [Burkholderiaceae bacterium]